MIDKKLVEFIAKKLGIERQELVEKDLTLQKILQELVKNKAFKEDFAFKGGTCLIKCYLGYYRFSEDLDFTYIHQKHFKGKSEKQTRKILSQKIGSIIALLDSISDKIKLDFKPDKNNHKYIEFGGSNKFVTFKLWYTSLILNQKTFIKIQINFIEKLLHPLVSIKVNPIITNEVGKEIKFIFKENSLAKPFNARAYSLNEILIEKIRAILTRRGIKARDFIDVYLIQKEIKVNLKEVEKGAIDKITFMLKYEKYVQNIKNKPEELKKELIIGKEEGLLLKNLPHGYENFVKEFLVILLDIINRIHEK